MKFTEVEVCAKFFQIVCGIHVAQKFFVNDYIIKINEDKYRYFKCNFDDETNYAHTFEEKYVLL